MKTNGMRLDSSGGVVPLIGGGAGTPESITLSVDSLPQRQMYGSEAQKLPRTSTTPTWKRSSIIDITSNNPQRIDHPPQYQAQQVKYL